MVAWSPTAPPDEQRLVRAAREGDEEAFRTLVELHRPALHAHCYRMLASPFDADEAVQEALVRAWKGLRRFEGRSSFRTWLFKIATRTALDLAGGRGRRELPVGHSPSAPAGEAPRPADGEVPWMGPCPDSWASPETSYLEREATELAYVAALQYLTTQQRAVFLMREILRFRAAEVAATLGTTVAGVNSSLQRARAALRDRRPAVTQQEEIAALGAVALRDLAGRYADAIETGDLDGLLGLLSRDASWSMPPIPSWFRGHEAISRFLTEWVFPERWRHRTTWANGQLAVAGYLFDEQQQCFVPGALDVIDLREGKIAAVTGFLFGAGVDEPPAGNLAAFGLPDLLQD